MDKSTGRINKKTLQESLPEITPGLSYLSYRVDMHELPEDTFPWHWHGEVEIFFVEEGEMEYHTSGGVQTFRRGEAGFVNANVLHMTRAPGPEHAVQIEHIFLPEFIYGQPGSDIEMKYVRPILRGTGIDLFRFGHASCAIDLMREAHDIYLQRAEGFELKLRSLMSELWMEIFRQTRGNHGTDLLQNPDDERIKHMLSYINDHFAEKVALADIARAGLVSERECFRIFRCSLGSTPLDCLVRKRLTHAGSLLRTTAMPIHDIALASGFCSASYFSKVFREHFNVTPREYRDQ